MSEEITNGIKKQIVAQASSSAAHISASLLGTNAETEETSMPPESKGIRSEEPINLVYGRVFQGDGEKFELILLCCYQHLINSTDKPSIQQLCTWFNTHQSINVKFTTIQLAGLVPAKICFIPTFAFNQESLLPIIKEYPDNGVPTAIKSFANDYAKNKKAWPVKVACMQLIASLADRIYSNMANIDTVKRKEELTRLLSFVNSLQDKTDIFYFLVPQGKSFKSFLHNCKQTIQNGMRDIEKLTKKPLRIEKWLSAYHHYATELLDQLIPYSDYLSQDVVISESSHKVLSTNIFTYYKDILTGTTVITLSANRIKTILGIVEKAITLIHNEGFNKQPATLTDLKSLINAKKISLLEAGFYYEYFLNSPESRQALKSALSGQTPYKLTADQFLRELIYGFKELRILKDDEVLKAALTIYKTKINDRAEYALVMLRCRVLNPKNLLDEALYLKQQSQHHDKAEYYLNLAKQAFNPVIIDLSTDTGRHIDTWRPGVIATFKSIAEFKGNAEQTSSYLDYAKIVFSLTSVYSQLSAYAWFTKSLEWAVKGLGNDTIVVIYREFLESLSKHTLEVVLPIVSRALLEMDATRISSLRNRLKSEAAEYKSNPSIQRWQNQQAEIEQKPFYRSLLRSLLMLKNICKELEKYVSEPIILAGIREDQNLTEMLASACDSIDKSLPDAKQQLTAAKVFFDEMHSRLYKLLNGDKESKSHSPHTGPIEVKAEQTKIDSPPPAEFPDSKHEELIERLSILTAQRDHIHKLKSEGHLHSKLDKKQDEMDKQISAIENRLQNVRSKQPEQKHDQGKTTITSTSPPASPLNTPPVSPVKPKQYSSPKEQQEEIVSLETTAATLSKDHKDSVVKKLDSYLLDSLYDAISLPTLLQEFLLQAKEIANSLPSQSLSMSRIYYEKIGNILSKISKKIADIDENLKTIKEQIIIVKKELIDEINFILQGKEELDEQSLQLQALNQTLAKRLHIILILVIEINRISDHQHVSSSSSSSSASLYKQEASTSITTSELSSPKYKEELLERLSILTAQRGRIHQLKREGHSHSRLDKEQEEMDKQISEIENELENAKSKRPEQKESQNMAALMTSPQYRASTPMQRASSINSSSSHFKAPTAGPQHEQYIYPPSTEGDRSSSFTTAGPTFSNTNIAVEDLEDEEESRKCVIL